MKDDERPAGARQPGGKGTGNAEHEGGISASEFAGVGLQFAAAIIIFLFAGQWLDRKLGTDPWFVIIGVFTGAGAAFYSMYRKLMAAQAREEAQRQARDKQL